MKTRIILPGVGDLHSSQEECLGREVDSYEDMLCGRASKILIPPPPPPMMLSDAFDRDTIARRGGFKG